MVQCQQHQHLSRGTVEPRSGALTFCSSAPKVSAWSCNSWFARVPNACLCGVHTVRRHVFSHTKMSFPTLLLQLHAGMLRAHARTTLAIMFASCSSSFHNQKKEDVRRQREVENCAVTTRVRALTTFSNIQLSMSIVTTADVVGLPHAVQIDEQHTLLTCC